MKMFFFSFEREECFVSQVDLYLVDKLIRHSDLSVMEKQSFLICF